METRTIWLRLIKPFASHCFTGEFSVAATTHDDVTNFTRGDNMTLLCDVSGDDTEDIHVTWSKDGDMVVNSERYVTEDRRLMLYDATPDDSGRFTCDAIRRQQQSDASIDIAVHGMHNSIFVVSSVNLILPLCI